MNSTRKNSVTITINHNRCDRCATCISVCPTDAIMLTTELIIDQTRCIGCLRCVDVCPYAALEVQSDPR